MIYEEDLTRSQLDFLDALEDWLDSGVSVMSDSNLVQSLDALAST